MRTVKLYNWNKPLAERLKGYNVCGPYYMELPPLPGSTGWKETGRGGIGGYLSSNGKEIKEGSVMRLRVITAQDAMRACQGEYPARHMSGWIYNDFGETMYGIVARLPSGRGFLAGWTMGEGMSTSLDADIYDDLEKAARAADSSAESAAEGQRQYEYEEDIRIKEEAEAEQKSELYADGETFTAEGLELETLEAEETRLVKELATVRHQIAAIECYQENAEGVNHE